MVSMASPGDAEAPEVAAMKYLRGGTMTTIDLPRDVPRSARAAYFAAALLMNETGEVPGGMAELHRVLGHDDPNATQRAVRACEEHGLLWRKGHLTGGRQRLFVVVNREKSPGCVNCGKPKRAEWSYCPRCAQHFRADRAWRIDAVHLAVRNLATHGEPKPASVAVAVAKPLFPRGEDQQGSAVVPWLLSQGLLGEEWQRALAEVVGDHRRAAQMVREMRTNARTVSDG